MPIYVADSHALLWYLGGSPRLGEAARIAFDEAVSGTSRVVVPAIVLAEIVMILEKRRAPIGIDRVITELQSVPGFALAALRPEIALGIKDLTALPDIHDRLIVAEALSAGATVITSDQEIVRSGLVPIVW